MALKFRLLRGIHSENRKVYEPGSEIVSTCDLVARFGPEKFLFLEEVKDTAKSFSAAPPAHVLGEDVTDDFEDASVRGVQVFKKGANYFVAAKGSDTALNDKPLKLSAVEDFIAKLK